MKRAEVAVAVTTCGRPAALRRCLEGLAQSSRRPEEVIVVDQAPSVDSRAVAAAPFDGLRIRHLEQQRLGLSAARNLALEAADARLLAVTDDDCVPDVNWLEALVAAFERAPEPAAVTGSILPPPGVRPPGSCEVSSRSDTVAQDFCGRHVPWRVGSGGNFAAPVELLRRTGGWDQRLGVGSRGRAAEDTELLYRILSSGLTVRYEPCAIVRHDWQPRARRLATRWSYGFGVGAMCGIVLRHRDAFGLRMLGSYARLHLDAIARAAFSRRLTLVAEHGRALVGLPAGLLYGLQTGRPTAAAKRTGP